MTTHTFTTADCIITLELDIKPTTTVASYEVEWTDKGIGIDGRDVGLLTAAEVLYILDQEFQAIEAKQPYNLASFVYDLIV